MAKKITLKNKNGDVLCPHTAIEQVKGLKEALDNKLGKTEKAASAKATKVTKSSEADPNFALSFYAGQAEVSTTPTADKVYVGSRVDPNIISVPKLDGSTSMANYMNLRMSFNSRYFHEIAALPNYDGIYHRMVYDGNALEWKQLAYKSDVDTKLGKTEKAVSASKLITTNWSGIDVNNRSNSEGVIEYHSMLPNTTANIPTANGYQNAVMSFGLLSNGATAQMFFSRDNPLYYRSSQTAEWRQLAYKDDVDNIEIGGRNLALNSDVSVSNASYLLYTCSLSEALVQGETYTFTVWGTLGSDRDNFNLYESIGGMPQGEVKLVSDGKYSLTFKYNRLSNSDDKVLRLYQMPSASTSTSTIERIKIEKGNKATDWSPAPEDVQANISNAETRSKAHAEDYTNDAIDKIENGQTVAQKANSLYDDDSGTYKNWGEIDSTIRGTIGTQFENYATKQYVDNKVASIGTPGNATETGAGIVRAATQAEVTAGHVSDNDPSEMAFVRPETLQSKLSNYPTTTAMTQAINESRQIIYYQSSQPSGGKNGDIWIIP